MKKITQLFIMCFFTLFIGVSNLFSAPDPNFHIYICFGQSNMEGATQAEDIDKVNVNERFQMMATVNCSNRQMGNWYTAVPPLARCNTGLSPADYFGRTLVEKLDENIRVGVIVVAVGGADIQLFEEDGYQEYINSAADWLKNWAKEYDYNCYKRIIDMAKIAQQDGVIKGILVHQGETNNMQQSWPGRLKAIYENMLSDLNLKGEDVPLLVGETRRDGACSGHNQVIATVPNVIPNSYVISSEGLEKVNDDFHFSAQGYRDFGKRYAEQMLKLLPTSSEPEEENPTDEPEEDLSNLPITGAKGGTNIYVNNRQVFVYAPQSIKSNRPLVISMHGMNQDINYQKQMCQWESIADTANFVVAYPSGENASWDCFGSSDKDTKYLIAIIDKMYEDYKIDRSRVYLSGFSMGGMMTYYCMNNIPDYFAAFAPISGYRFGLTPNPNTRPVPLFHTHGTGDDVVHFEPYDNQEGAQAVVDAWKAHNNCTETTQIKVNNCTDRTIYSGGDCGVEVVLNAIPGRGHEPRNDNCHHTSLEIWKFVSKYTNKCGGEVVRPVIPQTPYNGTPAPIPGKIEAEEFDDGGANNAYYDLDTQNRNGGDRNEGVDMSNTAIGYTQKGEWIEYTVDVAEAGEYLMEAFVASGADGSSFKLYIDDEPITEDISVPNTGDWETFVVVESNVELPSAGEHVLKLEITGDWLDMDYMQFSLNAQGTSIKVPFTDSFFDGGSFDVLNLLGQKILPIQTDRDLEQLETGVYLLRNNKTNQIKKILISE